MRQWQGVGSLRLYTRKHLANCGDVVQGGLGLGMGIDCSFRYSLPIQSLVGAARTTQPSARFCRTDASGPEYRLRLAPSVTGWLAAAVPDVGQQIIDVDEFADRSVTAINERLADSGDEPLETKLVGELARPPVSVARGAASIGIGHDISMLDGHADDEYAFENRCLNLVGRVRIFGKP